MTEVVTQLELDEINRKREANFLPRLTMSQARRLSIQRKPEEADTSLTDFLLFVTLLNEFTSDSNDATPIDTSFTPDNSQFTNDPSQGDFSGGGAQSDWGGQSDSGSNNDSSGGNDFSSDYGISDAGGSFDSGSSF
jgi:hypothetical protein